MGYGAGTNVETMKKFQKETLSLRDEIMTKKLELQSEYNKPTPDTNRIATIQKEIIDLRAKIQEIANKHGIKSSCRTGHDGTWHDGSWYDGRRHDGRHGRSVPYVTAVRNCGGQCPLTN